MNDQGDDILTEAIRRRRRKQSNSLAGLVIDILMFRRMITPWLIRVFFVQVMILCAVSAGLIVYQEIAAAGSASSGRIVQGGAGARSRQRPISIEETPFDAEPNSPPASSYSPPTPSRVTTVPSVVLGVDWQRVARVLWPLFTILVVRIACEGCIVLFQINETLIDIHRMGRERKLG